MAIGTSLGAFYEDDFMHAANLPTPQPEVVDSAGRTQDENEYLIEGDQNQAKGTNTPIQVSDKLSNFQQATQDLGLNQQEQDLYQRHLNNLSGPGGVDNADGSRSTLYQSVQEHNGMYYSVPTVWNGARETQPYTQPDTGKVFDVPNDTAMQNIEKTGWDAFPSYKTPEEADDRYSKMHDYMEKDTEDFLNSRKK